MADGPASLLLGFAELSDLLASRLSGDADRRHSAEDLLDAFLLAAGMNQVVEDHLHRDPYALGKVANRLPEALGGPLGRVATVSPRLLRAGLLAMRAVRPRERRLIRWQTELAALVQRLAAGVAGAANGAGVAPAPASHLLAAVDRQPSDLLRSVVRIAPCFRNFDQSPDDCRRLVESFAARWPDRRRPVLVVGIRTSGSYLAPLCAAVLEARGYEQVDVATLRPGQHWLRAESRRLARTLRANPMVLVVDDPPRTGAQLAFTATHFEGLGVRREDIVLLVQLVGPAGSLPKRLRPFELVVLPWEEWAIHEQLSCKAVRDALTGMLVGRSIAPPPGHGPRERVVVDEVRGVQRAQPPDQPAAASRGHTSGVFRVELVDAESGDSMDYQVYARGVGQGYFGRRELAVANALADFVPETYGVHAGVLYRAWLPTEWRLTARNGVEPDVAARIASYVAARSRAFPLERDISARLAGRGSAFENVADILAGAFGRAALAARPLTNRAARVLLRPAHPAVADGAASMSHWFADPSASPRADGLLKSDSLREHALATHCLDPVFDLASAAASYADRSAHARRFDFGDRLRDAYRAATREEISDERWLLHQLLFLDRVTLPDRPEEALAVQRTMEELYRRYWSKRYFDDVAVPDSGPLCAIDVDWVLEARWLAFPAIGPAGALALRALLRHGYRPVVATGRSLEDVRRRCRAYRLPGGVGEYGAVIYDSVSGEARSLLAPGEDADLAELRAALEASDARIRFDPAHRHTVRAYVADESGRRSGLAADAIQSALATTGLGARVKAMRARTQTDFAIARVDKGTGLRALADGFPGDARVALAVGDALPDLPLLDLASEAFIPRHASAELRRLVRSRKHARVTRRAGQAGLLEAVASVLGHDPRRCTTCQPEGARPADAKLLATILGALDGGRREKLAGLAGLASRLAVR